MFVGIAEMVGLAEQTGSGVSSVRLKRPARQD